MPTVTFGGVGSGIDTESIISGLLSASRGPMNRVQLQQSQTQSAVSSVSDVGNLLSKLKDALVALDTSPEVGSFKATSDNKAVAVSATGAARPGAFKVEVTQLATAYKAYSDPLGVSASNQALNQAGTLSLSIGATTKDITIQATDTLDMVMSKINTSGLRVAATSFFDGTAFRLQVRGLDTGDENDVTVAEAGTTFNFNGSFGGIANTKSTGQDASLTVDDIAVTSKTNQIKGAIGGVTLALAEVTTSGPANVVIESDAQGFKDKLTNLVNAYNAVVTKIHTEAGFGSQRAANPALAGDSALRAVTNSLNRVLTEQVGTGKFKTLGSIGVQLKNNGTLELNSTKLDAALAEDPDAVSKVLAGDDDAVKGIADLMAKVATDLLGPKGAISARKDGLAALQKTLAGRVDVEQSRLDRMEQQLRKQFTQMDGVVAANNAQLSFLQR